MEEHKPDEYYLAQLNGFYGKVLARQNRAIISNVAGHRVLDLGCGFGTLTAALREKGFDAVGVDIDPHSISFAKNHFNVDVVSVSAENMSCFPDGSFDTVILKESLHHLANECDSAKVMGELRRVTARRLIVFDPNPTFILKTLRNLIKHKDPEITPRQSTELLSKYGFKIVSLSYSDFFGMPLSGGLISKRLLPHIGVLEKLVLGMDSALIACTHLVRLDSCIAFRFLLVADVA